MRFCGCFPGISGYNPGVRQPVGDPHRADFSAQFSRTARNSGAIRLCPCLAGFLSTGGVALAKPGVHSPKTKVV